MEPIRCPFCWWPASRPVGENSSFIKWHCSACDRDYLTLRKDEPKKKDD